MSRAQETARIGERPPRRLREDEFLDRAASLIARGWCQKAFAEDRAGRPVEPWSDSACRWSPVGALTKVWYEHRDGGREAFEVAYAALALATGGRPEEWNAARWRTTRHVLNAFDHAREYLPVARQEVRDRTVDLKPGNVPGQR